MIHLLKRFSVFFVFLILFVGNAFCAFANSAENRISGFFSETIDVLAEKTVVIPHESWAETLCDYEIASGYLVVANKIDNFAAPAKRNSGSTVLGHHPKYLNLADSLGHRRFDIPTSVWDEMSDAQRWTANQKFLDRTISRGDGIILSTPLDQVRLGNYFARELEYLSGRGYRPSADGARLIPGGN